MNGAPNFRPLVRADGQLLTDAGHWISSWQVDFREPARRPSITTLIKACEQQYAIEHCGSIRLSKPEHFRQQGESLIYDPQEGRVSRITSKRVDDPDDLAEAELQNDEVNRAIELAGGTARFTTKSTTRTTSESIATDRNGWIFCAAIPPTSQYQDQQFWQSMDPAYDHASSMLRPRAFALALASMLAEQCGPKAADTTVRSRLGDLESSDRRKSQTIFHGPVIYVEDPYETISEARSELGSVERLLLPAFVKSSEYEHQREYRFVIWADKEPSAEVVYLKSSLAMQGAMTEQLDLPGEPEPIEDTGVASGDPERESGGAGAAGGGVELPSGAAPASPPWPSMLDLLDDPSFPVAPHVGGETSASGGGDLVADAVVRALRIAIERLPSSRLVEASSAAFHAEPLLRGLCQEFEAPVRNISISPDNYVVVRMAAPSERGARASIVIGPHGHGGKHIERVGKTITGSLSVHHEIPLSRSIIDALAEAGVPLSPDPPKRSARAAAVGCSAVAGIMGFDRITSQPQGAPIRC